MNREHRLHTSHARAGRPHGDEPLFVSPQGTGVLPIMPSEAREDVAQLVHDLRSPISTIGLELEMLGAADQLAMKRIVRNLEFLDRIVQDLLDSYAIDAGELEIRRVPTELRALLERVIDRVVSTRDRGRVVLEAGHGVTLGVDPLRIERVVANLIGNAIKYAPSGSRIVVRLDIGPRNVQLSVTDTGPGMSPDEVAYVFDKHRRTPSAHVYEGSGIGLYVSKNIIEAHGGRIGVDSVRGAGSRFYFELALA